MNHFAVFFFAGFSLQEFEDALRRAVPASVLIGISSFAFTVVSCLYELVFESKGSFLTYIRNAVQFVFYLTATGFLFGISLVLYIIVHPIQ